MEGPRECCFLKFYNLWIKVLILKNHHQCRLSWYSDQWSVFWVQYDTDKRYCQLSDNLGKDVYWASLDIPSCVKTIVDS